MPLLQLLSFYTYFYVYVLKVYFVQGGHFHAGLTSSSVKRSCVDLRPPRVSDTELSFILNQLRTTMHSVSIDSATSSH